MRIATMYIPSFYGDIRLERESDETTRLVAEKVSDKEEIALKDLSVVITKKKWWLKDPLQLGEGTFSLKAPLIKVQKALTKLLKPGRSMVTAVKFSNGKLVEVVEEVQSAKPGTGVEKVDATVGGLVAPVGVAVAKPTLGCPEPDFRKAEIKARGVLEVFLNPEQMEDFRQHNRFISYGAKTGHRYMVTSRFARDELAKFHRSLYDLDDRKPLCVHDYSVPAAEEMLALHVMLGLENHEDYLRHLEN